MAELVFIHGAADSGAVWDLQTDAFAATHAVLPVDLPGHGQRLAEAPLATVDAMADEVVRLAQERGMTQPVLVGHSMGGVIALSVALRYPEFPRALVMVGSGARLRMRPEVLESARLATVGASTTEAAPPEIVLDQVVASATGPEARTWLTARFRQATARATYADFLAIHQFDALTRLAEITLPVLIIAGESDAWTPPRFQQFMADQLPNVRLELLPHTAHYPFVEQGATFNELLDHFLTELASSRSEPGALSC